jgi:hypothetical protein
MTIVPPLKKGKEGAPFKGTRAQFLPQSLKKNFDGPKFFFEGRQF